MMRQLWRKYSKSSGHADERRVDFAICGTQKGGTSALRAYLEGHPEICMAAKKEAHFFDDESLFGAGPPDYAAYHALFAPGASHRLMGEVTPVYMYWHEAPRRMWEYNPDMNLIVILRNPIDRAYSHWNMLRSRNVDSLPFSEAIRNEERRCREALPYQHRLYSYVDRGFYLEQLRRLWHYFSRRNVLVLRHENLRERPFDALAEVCRFLGVAEFEGVEPTVVHATDYLSKMADEERKYLRSVFEHEIRGIERTLGWDCSGWLTDPAVP